MVTDRTPLTPQQQAMLDGLRRAAQRSPSAIGADWNVDQMAENMATENDQAVRNQATIAGTPAHRRGQLAMSPDGDVYYPSRLSMGQIGHERVYGGMRTGHQPQPGIAALTDPSWAGFSGHFADKDRFFRAYAQKGLRISGGPYG